MLELKVETTWARFGFCQNITGTSQQIHFIWSRWGWIMTNYAFVHFLLFSLCWSQNCEEEEQKPGLVFICHQSASSAIRYNRWNSVFEGNVSLRWWKQTCCDQISLLCQIFHRLNSQQRKIILNSTIKSELHLHQPHYGGSEETLLK